MGYDLDGIDREVHRNLQFDPIFQQADRYVAINDTILDLVEYTEFTDEPWVTDSEVGQIEYNLPEGTIKVATVMYDRHELKPMTRDQWVRAGGNTGTSQNTPRRYWVRNNKFLNIYPRPNAVKEMNVFIVEKPELLDEATETPVLPSYCFQAIVDGACWRLLKNEPEHRDQAQDFERKYLRDRGELDQGLNRNKRRKVRRVVF